MMSPRCLIFCHSENTFVNVKICKDDYVIAADSGYLYASRCGIAPNVLIGDFDSIPFEILCTVLPKNRITLPSHKNETDTHYAVEWALRKGFEEIVICGGLTGRRVSHTFANVATLKFIADNGKNGFITDGYTTAHIVNEGCTLETNSISENSYHGTYKLKEGQPYISVFPLVLGTVVTLQGLAYPLLNYPLSLNIPIGVSNERVNGIIGQIVVVNGQAVVLEEI